VSVSGGIVLRPATPEDVPTLVTLVHELAGYERLADDCIADSENVQRALFEERAAEAVIAEVDGAVAGYAIYFRSFSTFLMRPGIYLEDLFVRPRFRKRGVGFALLRHLAKTARERGYARVEWSVLRWNQLAIDFYRRIGAESLDGWLTFRLAGEALDRVAADSMAQGQTSG
jgi:ribosomal protein S18 acetylase RimI-like enzyme